MRTSRIFFRPRSNRGVAIILVLGALVFLSILAVAFVGSINRELTASKSYASGSSARLHAEAAVNIVIGQLQAGTTVDDPGKTWVSQPGLIRRYDDQGNLDQVLKLYSSSKMIDGSSFSPLTPGGAPSDVPAWTASTPTNQLPWNLNPGVYTDLNSPIVANGKAKYPILNPGGLSTATKIQGFDVAAGYGLPDSADINGNGNTTEIAQIPMPVQWLYILSDGRLATAAPFGSGDKTVQLSLADGTAVAVDNPAVARVAFWTDDDTCRLNINTASEGSYWTLPVAAAADDGLSTNQVNVKEYQRYPGHPATTSLSPILEFLTTNTNDLINFIYGISPRIAGRGSQGGTRTIGYGLPVTPDNDRLFASVDDLLFLPTVNTADGKRYAASTANIKALKEGELDFTFTNFVATNMTGVPYSFTTNFSLDPDRLELIRFFLTANSRAPEVNLFGKPRVSLWPVDTRSTYQSIYDRLLAFCGTLNGKAYYFQRQNPDSQSEDYDSITRNQDLFSYLDRLTSAKIPGSGGNFSTKYSSGDRQQLLTSIFDWIRTVNLAYRDKTGVVQPYDWQPNTPSGTEKPPGKPGSGQVLPIKIGATQGYGRFPLLSKGAFAIVREEELPNTPAANQTTVKYRAVFLMETYVPLLGYAGYVPNYQIVVQGLAGGFEFIANTPSTIGTPIVLPANFQDGNISVNVPANVEPFYGRAWGGTQGFNNLFLCSTSGNDYGIMARTLGSTDATSGYPFVSAQFQVVYPTADKDKIKVGLRPADAAAEHKVTVHIKNSTGAQNITSYELNFPSFGPVPGAFLGDPLAGLGELSNPPISNTADINKKLLPTLQGRVNQMAVAWKIFSGGFDYAWTSYKNIIGPIDVVRGMEFVNGDLRLLVKGSSSSNKFVPHANYANTAFPQAHSLLSSGGSYAMGSNAANDTPNTTKAIKRGFLVTGSAAGFASGTPLNYLPQAPSAMTTASGAGDFSTGIASEGDGPHIIKADEGNSSYVGHNWGMSVPSPYQNQLFPYDDRLSATFSPNRQVASAVQLGTLPTKAFSGTPWQTLLFRPDLNTPAHPGSATPADSWLLDIFWMPVVDPYPISQPLSTAGKVNMNSQIAPFTYIERSTALLGALKSVKILAFPADQSEFYKWSGYVKDESKSRWAISYLYEVDAAKTLLFFKERFSNTDANQNIFKSASEICSIPLAPKQNTSSIVSTGHPDNTPAHATASANIYGATTAVSLRSAIRTFWQKNTLAGDNVLESPYNHLYPRLTTQSDSYTVYVKAQTLQVPKNSVPGRFSENQIKVTGEYRGSYAVERYLNPNDPAIPDFAQASNFNKTIYPYYKFRTRSAKQFLP